MLHSGQFQGQKDYLRKLVGTPRVNSGPNFEETAKNHYSPSVISCEDDKEYFDNFGMSNAKKMLRISTYIALYIQKKTS